MHDPHRPDLAIVDTDGRLIIGTNHDNGPIDIAQVNHYFCKTQEEFIKKITRGSSDGTPTRKIDAWHAHNMNEVDDNNALWLMHSDKS
jgi:ABC-type tungstate transport system permease subunit